MAINIKFDLVGNPEPPTIILAKRNGDKLGQLDVNADSIELSDKFNDISEITFTLNKYINGEITPLWDKVVDFKLIYCKEWDCWFEIKVELDEATETVKTVFGTQLGQAELSQIILYNIEINTEKDIERPDYKISILYDENDPKSSILNRLLEKAPHYSIAHVDDTIKKIQRSFSFDGNSICEAFEEIAEEIGCLFVYNSNSDESGKIQRTISVYDLWQYCNDCGHRGEYGNKCSKCNSKNITNGYGEDTLIFVTADELASNGIQLTTDTDSVKNCFKLEAGDDLMTAAVRSCNPNGTDYIWRFSDTIKEDMSEELIKKLESYDEEYKRHYNGLLLCQNETKVLEVGKDIYVGEYIIFKCLNENIDKAKLIVYDNDNNIMNSHRFHIGYESTYGEIIKILINESMGAIELNEYVECYVTKSHSVTESIQNAYNEIVVKYGNYKPELEQIPNYIVGYPSLMNIYYDTIDLNLYLKSGLMSSVPMSGTTAKEQAGLLTASDLSPVAVANPNTVSVSTVNSAVLAMAKILVKSTYKVQVNNSSLSDDKKTWTGNFVVTNYSDEEDTAISQTINVDITGNNEDFIRQKIEKALNKEDAEDLSISGLFKKEYVDFCDELKKYALNPLIGFRDACQSCIDILIEQGVGENSSDDLYKNLYSPYYDKLKAIEAEIQIRENEINVISGVYDVDSNLTAAGLQTEIDRIISRIQNSLDFEKFLGEELWLEFCAYRREDKYTNDNYISDGLNNADLFKRALEFFEVAENEIYKASELQHSLSTSLNNLLAIPKFKPLIESFNTGNWIRVRIDEKIFKLRLLEYDIDFGDFENISVEFSDATKIKNGATDIKSVLSQASSMASSYSSVRRQASQGEKSNSLLNNWVENGLNATQAKIVDSVDENLLFYKNGFWCRQYDPIAEKYSDEQIKIINSTIAITDDNWNTTKTAIGKFYYIDPKTGEEKVAYGVNGETIVGKLLIGEGLIISNSNDKLVFDDNGFVVSGKGESAVRIQPSEAESIFNIKNNNGDYVLYLDNDTGDLLIKGNIISTKLEVENDDGTTSSLSNVAISGRYEDLIDEPTKLSQFTNDTNFITKDVNNLSNYYNKNTIDNSLSSLVDESVDNALEQAKENGEFDGKDGTSATHSWNGTTLTITSASGTSSADLKGDKGDSPVREIDYWTNDDKSEIVNAVIEELRNQGIIS